MTMDRLKNHIDIRAQNYPYWHGFFNIKFQYMVMFFFKLKHRDLDKNSVLLDKNGHI